MRNTWFTSTTVAVKLYSVFFKFFLTHRLRNQTQTPIDENISFGISSRSEESIVLANPSFTDGVANKDIHIDPFTSLSVIIFLPVTVVSASAPTSNNTHSRFRVNSASSKASSLDNDFGGGESASASASTLVETTPTTNQNYHFLFHGNNYGAMGNTKVTSEKVSDAESLNLRPKSLNHGGYSPSLDNRNRKLLVIFQFHGGGFVLGSTDSFVNDLFCGQIAKSCDVMVIAVGYRLAPESRYSAAFEDGMKVLNWLAKQANFSHHFLV